MNTHVWKEDEEELDIDPARLRHEHQHEGHRDRQILKECLVAQQRLGAQLHHYSSDPDTALQGVKSCLDELTTLYQAMCHAHQIASPMSH